LQGLSQDFAWEKLQNKLENQLIIE